VAVASFGVLVAGFIVFLLRDVFEGIGLAPAAYAVGVVLGTAWWLGGRAERALARGDNRFAVGMALALATVAVSTMVTVLPFAVGGALRGEQGLVHYVTKPLLAVFLYGGVPAGLLGVFYGFLVARPVPSPRRRPG
jgi:hypothetical protein